MVFLINTIYDKNIKELSWVLQASSCLVSYSKFVHLRGYLVVCAWFCIAKHSAWWPAMLGKCLCFWSGKFGIWSGNFAFINARKPVILNRMVPVQSSFGNLIIFSDWSILVIPNSCLKTLKRWHWYHHSGLEWPTCVWYRFAQSYMIIAQPP